jgi:hypothetical protein
MMALIVLGAWLLLSIVTAGACASVIREGLRENSAGATSPCRVLPLAQTSTYGLSPDRSPGELAGSPA